MKAGHLEKEKINCNVCNKKYIWFYIRYNKEGVIVCKNCFNKYG